MRAQQKYGKSHERQEGVDRHRQRHSINRDRCLYLDALDVVVVAAVDDDFQGGIEGLHLQGLDCVADEDVLEGQADFLVFFVLLKVVGEQQLFNEKLVVALCHDGHLEAVAHGIGAAAHEVLLMQIAQLQVVELDALVPLLLDVLSDWLNVLDIHVHVHRSELLDLLPDYLHNIQTPVLVVLVLGLKLVDAYDLGLSEDAQHQVRVEVQHRGLAGAHLSDFALVHPQRHDSLSLAQVHVQGLVEQIHRHVKLVAALNVQLWSQHTVVEDVVDKPAVPHVPGCQKVTDFGPGLGVGLRQVVHLEQLLFSNVSLAQEPDDAIDKGVELDAVAVEHNLQAVAIEVHEQSLGLALLEQVLKTEFGIRVHELGEFNLLNAVIGVPELSLLFPELELLDLLLGCFALGLHPLHVHCLEQHQHVRPEQPLDLVEHFQVGADVHGLEHLEVVLVGDEHRHLLQTLVVGVVLLLLQVVGLQLLQDHQFAEVGHGDLLSAAEALVDFTHQVHHLVEPHSVLDVQGRVVRPKPLPEGAAGDLALPVQQPKQRARWLCNHAAEGPQIVAKHQQLLEHIVVGAPVVGHTVPDEVQEEAHVGESIQLFPGVVDQSPQDAGGVLVLGTGQTVVAGGHQVQEADVGGAEDRGLRADPLRVGVLFHFLRNICH